MRWCLLRLPFSAAGADPSLPSSSLCPSCPWRPAAARPPLNTGCELLRPGGQASCSDTALLSRALTSVGFPGALHGCVMPGVCVRACVRVRGGSGHLLLSLPTLSLLPKGLSPPGHKTGPPRGREGPRQGGSLDRQFWVPGKHPLGNSLADSCRPSLSSHDLRGAGPGLLGLRHND